MPLHYGSFEAVEKSSLIRYRCLVPTAWIDSNGPDRTAPLLSSTRALKSPAGQFGLEKGLMVFFCHEHKNTRHSNGHDSEAPSFFMQGETPSFGVSQRKPFPLPLLFTLFPWSPPLLYLIVEKDIKMDKGASKR